MTAYRQIQKLHILIFVCLDRPPLQTFQSVLCRRRPLLSAPPPSFTARPQSSHQPAATTSLTTSVAPSPITLPKRLPPHLWRLALFGPLPGLLSFSARRIRTYSPTQGPLPPGVSRTSAPAQGPLAFGIHRFFVEEEGIFFS
jgi:hypothetical protein